MRAGCGLAVSIPSRACPASCPVTPIAPSVTRSRKFYWVPTRGAAVSPHPLRLPRDAAVPVDLAGQRARAGRVGPPLGHQDQARIDEVQTTEREVGELVSDTRLGGHAGRLVCPLEAHDSLVVMLRRDVGGDQVAAGRPPASAPPAW